MKSQQPVFATYLEQSQGENMAAQRTVHGSKFPSIAWDLCSKCVQKQTFLL